MPATTGGVLRARLLADAAEATARNRARRDGLGREAAARRGRQARQAVEQRFADELLALVARYGFSSLPQLDDPSFVSALVFDATKPPGTPKGKFAYLFPSKGAAPGRTALVQVRLEAGLSEARRAEAIALVRAAVAMAQFKPRNGATYTVTGAPVVVSDLVGVDRRFAAHAARRRAARHGGDAPARLPRPPTAAAARARARRPWR